MKYLTWLLKAAIFFTLFAFALNNQNEVAVYFFFGTVWKAPLVLVVLATFASGLALGVLLMTPRWWRKNRVLPSAAINTHNSIIPSTQLTSPNDNLKIPRHGL